MVEMQSPGKAWNTLTRAHGRFHVGAHCDMWSSIKLLYITHFIMLGISFAFFLFPVKELHKRFFSLFINDTESDSVRLRWPWPWPLRGFEFDPRSDQQVSSNKSRNNVFFPFSFFPPSPYFPFQLWVPLGLSKEVEAEGGDAVRWVFRKGKGGGREEESRRINF